MRRLAAVVRPLPVYRQRPDPGWDGPPTAPTSNTVEDRIRAAVRNEDLETALHLLARLLAPLAGSFRFVHLPGGMDHDDLLQETYLRAAARLRAVDFSAEPSIQAYFKGIARRIVLEQRTRRSAREGSASTALLDSLGAEEPAIARLEAKEERARLRKRLSSLPREYRLVLLLLAKGLSASDSARILRRDVAQTRALIHRARVAARRALEVEVARRQKPAAFSGETAYQVRPSLQERAEVICFARRPHSYPKSLKGRSS